MEENEEGRRRRRMRREEGEEKKNKIRGGEFPVFSGLLILLFQQNLYHQL